MSKIVAVLLVAVGLLHLLPMVGVLGAQRLAALYGVTPTDPQLVMLMRHRAVLLGLVGLLCCAAALHRPYRWAAIASALLATVSFVALAIREPALTPELRRVMWADVAAIAALVAASVIEVVDARSW